MSRKFAIGYLLSLCALAACGNEEPPAQQVVPPVTSNPPPAQAAAPFAITRLPDGPHMGIIVGFDDLSAGDVDRQGRSTELLDQAASSGASISRIQLDWAELETAPVQYDLEPLSGALEVARQRRQLIYVTLSTLDSDGLTLPDYLLDDNGRLRDGLSLASPEVTGRFEDFLEW
ncbi:MAG: hypothetical protein AAFQ27_07325, partial [Pseudomonadota bacterium]